MGDTQAVVIIEDEENQASLLRDSLEAANAAERFGQNVVIWPPGRSVSPGRSKYAYKDMESFAISPEGRAQREFRGFIIADLFLQQDQVDPVAVFHQLMFSLFKSPTDFSLVCGRLGVLRKLVEAYKNAHVEVYTYFPTYFTTINETIQPDRVFYLHHSLSDVRKFASERKKDFETFLGRHSLVGERLGINTLQNLALYDALEDRIRGIFECRDIFDHVTDIPKVGDKDFSGSVKTDSLGDSVRKLVGKIEKWFAEHSRQSEVMR